ncbi:MULTISPECIES: SDR family NAD(P)-dependent oxidoreductase [Nocardiaceae]|jgi:NAD(P)-dependent dehydrogenase (short-subunit alcohol dehydrogenase family)|uniref:SDR family NAD(P)-dependent oxidoreductase n=1 Tax=Nocardiaceae TaxID=85025 RepID=UPI000AE6A885|nr:MULTISPECIES: SDR family oxidoreductase [Rhodococcus]
MTPSIGMEAHSTTPGQRLLGRKIVVTGAASGIGKSTAQLFASEGASLALLDRDERGVMQSAELTGGTGYAVDITDEEAVGYTVDRAGTALGGIDGVVNAAGIMFRGLASDVTAADWRHVLEVNLTGAYIVLRSCIPWLQKEETATIVNIASAQGLLPNAPGYTAYAASKGGVLNLTRVLAAELAPTVRVNSVCPGMVDTAMADGHRNNVGNYALGRLAEPIEIARSILFLTSSESSYVTGSALATDGGRSFH